MINDTNTYDVLGDLKSTKSQIIIMNYEYTDGVSFNHGGRNNLLRKSLGKLYKIHGHLVYNLDY